MRDEIKAAAERLTTGYHGDGGNLVDALRERKADGLLVATAYLAAEAAREAELAKKPYKRSAYAEKLLDPRWQKMRLEVLQRDSFSCQHCGDKTKTLHVHHTYYQYGKDPWDYDAGSLITYCEDCHTLAEQTREDLRELIPQFDLVSQTSLREILDFLVNLSPDVASEVLGSARDLALETYREEESNGTYKARLAIQSV